jgi:endonuclease YncB( thermonuclease family)
LLIGKSVVVRKEHDFGNRSYGEVWFQEESVRHLIVSKGWAEVSIKEKKVSFRSRGLMLLFVVSASAFLLDSSANSLCQDKEGQPMEPRKEDQELLQLQEQAKSKKSGMWGAAGNKHVRNVKYHENKKDTNPDVLFAFFEKNKNKPLTGMLGHEREGRGMGGKKEKERTPVSWRAEAGR